VFIYTGEKCGVIRQNVTLEMSYCVESIRRLNERIDTVEARIGELLEEHPLSEPFCSVPGVGPIVAAILLGEWVPLTRVATEAGCATYAGVTPLARQSGQSAGRSQRGPNVNKRVLNALYRSSVACLRVSEVDRQYHQRKRLEYQKHPLPNVAALLSLSRQRHKLFFRIAKTGEMYDAAILKNSTEQRRNERSPLGATPVGLRPPSVAPNGLKIGIDML